MGIRRNRADGKKPVLKKINVSHNKAHGASFHSHIPDNSEYMLFSRSWSINIPGAIFTKPLLVVRVEFAEWTEHIQLRSPVIKGFIAIEPEQCIL